MSRHSRILRGTLDLLDDDDDVTDYWTNWDEHVNTAGILRLPVLGYCCRTCIVYKRNTHNTSIEKMEVFLCLKTDMEKKEKSLKQG